MTTIWIFALLAALLSGNPAAAHHSGGMTASSLACSVNDGAGGAPFSCPTDPSASASDLPVNDRNILHT
jgi:hypothetical protein